jgi:DNA (cytosine-5)-methyltransferase 1
MDRPAPSVTGKAGGQWVFNRPATTVAGDARIAQPGHHDWGNGRVNGDGIKVELWELGALQGFPKDYPWQGTKTEQARQIGNAVPPPLAAAVLGCLT